MNSVWMHCPQLIKSTITGWTKKKREKRKAETQTPESLQSKQALSVRLGERRLRDLRFLVGPMNMVHRSLKIEKAHVRAPKTDPKRSSASLLGNAVAVLNPALRIFPPKTLENWQSVLVTVFRSHWGTVILKYFGNFG